MSGIGCQLFFTQSVFFHGRSPFVFFHHYFFQKTDLHSVRLEREYTITTPFSTKNAAQASHCAQSLCPASHAAVRLFCPKALPQQGFRAFFSPLHPRRRALTASLGYTNPAVQKVKKPDIIENITGPPDNKEQILHIKWKKLRTKPLSFLLELCHKPQLKGKRR